MIICCSECGGKLRRVHRRFWERFWFQAVFQCPECFSEVRMRHASPLHWGPRCQCPRCGSSRLLRLEEPTRGRIRQEGLLNGLESLARGKLRYCPLCRLQFYDRPAESLSGP